MSKVRVYMYMPVSSTRLLTHAISKYFSYFSSLPLVDALVLARMRKSFKIIAYRRGVVKYINTGTRVLGS